MVYSLMTQKLIVLGVMPVVTFLSGLLPIRLVSSSFPSSSPKWKRLISLAASFSGGVFMAACLLDLFPDVRESVDHVLDEIEREYHTKVTYPVAEFIMVFGFLLVLFVEQCVLEYQEHRPRRPASPAAAAAVANSPSAEDRRHLVTPVSASADDTASDLFADQGPSVSEPEARGDLDHDHDGHSHDHDHGSGVALMMEHSILRAMLLLLALTFHSFFEGLAIGLQEDMEQMLSLFAAVMIHKCIMAASLTLNIAQTKMSLKSFLLSNTLFSLASPIGLAAGIVIDDLKQSIGRDIANSVLQGISGGTFLYITFFEVLPHELNAPRDRMLKVLCVILGFSVICALMFVAP